ncbi:long-chain fatty acid--CoA ligase [Alphaproteobacteria bacterium]|nr:long-chain fatty acid--CoA ligase [Alphaproteobacteria bacterium]
MLDLNKNLDHDSIKNYTKSLPALLIENAKNNPRGIALRQKRFGIWNEFTWLEYKRLSENFALGLHSFGFLREDKIAILSENRVEWLIAEIGMQYMGIIPVGVYPTSPSIEVKHILKSTDARCVVCEDQEQVDKVLEVFDDLPLLKNIIYIDKKGMINYSKKNLIFWDDFVKKNIRTKLEKSELLENSVKEITLDDVALIVPTSGSTGMPKPAMITHKNIEFIGRATENVINRSNSDRVLSYLPLCHVAEQLFSVFIAIYGGYSSNFGESIRTVNSDLRDIAPTIFLGVPRIWEKLNSEIIIQSNNANFFQKFFLHRALSSSKKFSNLWQKINIFLNIERLFWNYIIYSHIRNAIGLNKCRIAVSGAAPISKERLDFFRGIGIPLVEGFGMTETAGACAVQLLNKKSIGAIGFPIPGVEMKLSQEGELLIKGDCVFSGYYKNKEYTEESLKNGWLYTGDIAEIFSDGSVSIVDRKKDIMISAGGKNLTPNYIEQTIKSSIFIKECILIADKRKFPSALIQIDFDVVSNWAEKSNVVYTTFKSLVEAEAVKELIKEEVNKKNNLLSSVEQIKKYHLLTKELDHDDGEVTATMKVRRSKIASKYSFEIESMYE